MTTPPRRPLGRTGLLVSPIAFGAFKIGRNQKIKYAHAYDLPDDAETDRLLNGIVDIGINLIDTAPAYGISEARIGQFLSQRRNEIVLSTKVGETFENGASIYDFSAPAVRASVERSLRRLRTDVVDILLIHSDGNDAHILHETDCVPEVLKLREQGLARFVGLSGKTPQAAMESLAWADITMIEYHSSDTSHAEILPAAAERGIGVMVKKPLASGQIPPMEAIPWLLAEPAISTLVVGSLNLQHLRQNLALCSAE